MALVDQVRVIIADSPQYAKHDVPMNGTDLSFQVENFPVMAPSVIITPISVVPSQIDEVTGVIRFAAPVPAQTLIVEYNHVLLLDGQIGVFNDLYGDSVLLVAAACLDTIASSQALIQKKMKILDLETDGPALARALREHAKLLRGQHEELVTADDGGFEIAEMVYDWPSYMEKMYKDWQRGSL